MSAISIAITRVSTTLGSQALAFYTSDEFRARARLTDDADHLDKVNILLALLKRVALHPELVKVNVDELAKGRVFLQFFHVQTPVPYFELEPESALLRQLQEAVAINLASPMAKAARAHLRWTSAEKRQRLAGFVEARATRFSHALDWPSLTTVCSRNPQSQREYEAQHQACYRARDNHRTGVLARRNARLQAFLDIAGCSTKWFGLLASAVQEAIPAPVQH